MIVDRVMPPIVGRRYGGSLSSCKIMLVLINNDYSLGQGEERLNGFNHAGRQRNYDRSLFASRYSAPVTGLHEYIPFQSSWNLRSRFYHSLYKIQFLNFKPY